MTSTKQIRKLGFTGSTQIGHTIMSSCAKSNLKKVSLELGGKSPLIIFSDFDLDKAVRIALGSVFFNKVSYYFRHCGIWTMQLIRGECTLASYEKLRTQIKYRKLKTLNDEVIPSQCFSF